MTVGLVKFLYHFIFATGGILQTCLLNILNATGEWLVERNEVGCDSPREAKKAAGPVLGSIDPVLCLYMKGHLETAGYMNTKKRPPYFLFL